MIQFLNKYKEEYIFFITLTVVNIILSGLIVTIWRLLSAQAPQVFVQIPYTPANIKVDASASAGPVHQFWTGFAQGGEEARASMLTPTVNKMKTLKPSYIRLDHIFDDEFYGVASWSGGQLKFDFSKLDMAVNDITAMGAKPFFSLSYMPSALAASKIDVPRNWNDWSALVRATVEHYSGKNAKNISGVYYEVWNEPDLEIFGKWGRGGAKNYLTMYGFAVRGAMSVKNTQNYFIGGPATTGLYQNWMEDLYNYAADNQLRLDFISWHRYSFAPAQYSRDVADIHSWFAGRPLPRLVISEWGPTPEKSTSYSGNYAAAHSFAVVREMLDQLNLATAFEIKDGLGQGDSGWGLLGHETAGLFSKPRFTAFSWLSQVKGTRLSVTGEGTGVRSIAVRDNDKISVYLVNFGQGAQTEVVPVAITGVATGSGQLTREVMGRAPETNQVNIEDLPIQATIGLKPNEIGRIILTKN